MTLTERHKKLIETIYAKDYYVHIFEHVKNKCIVNENDPQSINIFWNEFWFALPDSPVIHRAPFNEVCNMAEGEYLDEQN